MKTKTKPVNGARHANLPGIATHYLMGEKLLCGRPRGGSRTTRITMAVDCKLCLQKLFGTRR